MSKEDCFLESQRDEPIGPDQGEGGRTVKALLTFECPSLHLPSYERLWLQRAPRDLAAAHLGVTSVIQTLCGLQEDLDLMRDLCHPQEGADPKCVDAHRKILSGWIVKFVVRLRDEAKEVAVSLAKVVEDFGAVAIGIPTLNSCYGSSMHALWADCAAITWQQFVATVGYGAEEHNRASVDSDSRAYEALLESFTEEDIRPYATPYSISSFNTCIREAIESKHELLLEQEFFRAWKRRYPKSVPRAERLTEAECNHARVQMQQHSDAGVKPKVARAIRLVHEKDHPKAATIAKEIGVQESTFLKHYVPILKSVGIRNDGDGYYDPGQRQT